MCGRRHSAAWVVLFVCFLGTAPVGADDGRVLTIVPEQTDEILANPGVGWQTFHRTAKQDKNLPSWIPSTVHYARYGWGELEPKQGQLDAAFLDGVLRESRESGQTLAFRVMCCSTTPSHPYHPKWLKDIGGSVVTTQRKDGPSVEVPDLDDPAILTAHLDFIKRLGARYDGHPDIDHIDLGTVGWWGEWHMSGSANVSMPTAQHQQQIVDAYLEAFSKTPLVMLVGGREMLKYATQHGTGWRADCLGDMGGFNKNWSHMRVGYPEMLTEAKATDVWQTAPVAWETCWDMRKWVDEGWSLRFIFNYALALHGSVINNKSAPLPQGDDIRPEVERFLRRLGHRLVLRELAHPSQAKAGAKIELAMKWQNVGSAPCYKPYRVAYRLTDTAGTPEIFIGSLTLDRFLPGSIELFTKEFFKQPPDLPPGQVVPATDALVLPEDISPGTYSLSIAAVGEDNRKPALRFGIKGRTDDGWYPLSKLRIME